MLRSLLELAKGTVALRHVLESELQFALVLQARSHPIFHIPCNQVYASQSEREGLRSRTLGQFPYSNSSLTWSS